MCVVLNATSEACVVALYKLGAFAVASVVHVLRQRIVGKLSWPILACLDFIIIFPRNKKVIETKHSKPVQNGSFLSLLSSAFP